MVTAGEFPGYHYGELVSIFVKREAFSPPSLMPFFFLFCSERNNAQGKEVRELSGVEGEVKRLGGIRSS